MTSVEPFWYDKASVLGSAIRYIASLSPKFHWVGIYRLEADTLHLGPYIGEPTEHREIPVGRGICGTAVFENRDMNVPDVTQVEEYLACSVKTRSELVVLIRNCDGKVLGQIDIDSYDLEAFGPDEEKWVRKVAEELGELWPE